MSFWPPTVDARAVHKDLEPILKLWAFPFLYTVFLLPTAVSKHPFFLTAFFSIFLPLLILPSIYIKTTVTADFGIGNNAVILGLLAFDRLIVSDLERDFNKPENTTNSSVTSDDEMELEEAAKTGEIPGTPVGLWARLMWAWRLLTWWNFEAPLSTTLRNTTKGRAYFFRSRLIRAVIYYALLDIIHTLQMQHTLYFNNKVSWASIDFWTRQIYISSAGLFIYLTISFAYDVFCLLFVAIGLLQPTECPPAFGQLKDVTSIRRLWSKFWHQFNRRFYTAPVRYLYRVINPEKAALLPKTTLPRTTLLWDLLSDFIPYTCSALQHIVACYVMNGSGSGAACFFFLQPFGIISQRIVDTLMTKLYVPQVCRHIFGYVTTLAWIMWTGPIFFDELIKAGFWDEALPLSFIVAIQQAYKMAF